MSVKMMDREKFYIENVDRIYHLLLKMSGNSDDARDLTQDTFLKFFRNEDSFKGEAQASTYLYRIAINTGINFIRRKKLHRKWFTNHQDEMENIRNDQSQNSTESGLFKKELDYLITRSLLSLPEKQAQCFYLSKVAGLPQKQIAQILQISVSAVETNVFRAKKALAKKLHEYMSEKTESPLSNNNEKRRSK